MQGYLGNFDVVLEDTPFASYTSSDWALYWIGRCGQFDGAHHKAWVLDRVARVLLGTKHIVKEARWDNGHSEYRVSLDEPSEEYLDWVNMMKAPDEDGEEPYEYNEGTPP